MPIKYCWQKEKILLKVKHRLNWKRNYHKGWIYFYIKLQIVFYNTLTTSTALKLKHEHLMLEIQYGGQSWLKKSKTQHVAIYWQNTMKIKIKNI